MASESDPVDSGHSATCLPLDKAQLAALFSGVGEAVYIEDIKSRRIVYWNAGAAALFGRALGEVPEQSVRALQEGTNHFGEAGDTTLSEVEKKGEWHGRRRFRRADGSVFDAETQIALLSTDRGNCAVVTVRPLTPSGPDGANTAPVAETPGHFGERSARRQAEGGADGEKAVGLLHIATYAVCTTDAAGQIRE
jgi:PAS domain-containing protein